MDSIVLEPTQCLILRLCQYRLVQCGSGCRSGQYCWLHSTSVVGGVLLYILLQELEGLVSVGGSGQHCGVHSASLIVGAHLYTHLLLAHIHSV